MQIVVVFDCRVKGACIHPNSVWDQLTRSQTSVTNANGKHCLQYDYKKMKNEAVLDEILNTPNYIRMIPKDQKV